jgi:hypothetical protein
VCICVFVLTVVMCRTFKCPGVTDTQGVGYFKSLQCLKVPGT